MDIIIFGYFVNKKYNKTENILDWISNVQKYYIPNLTRQIIIITDNKKVIHLQKLYDNLIVILKNDNFENIGNNKLLKFNFLNYIINNYTSQYICFFQSNMRCSEIITIKEIMDNHDIACAKQYWFQHDQQNYFNYYYKYKELKPTSIIQLSNIDTNKFIYYQDNHFIGKYAVIKSLTEWINSKIEYDKKNNSLPEYAPFDERYFNYYINTLNIDINSLNANIYNNIKNTNLTKIYDR